MLVHISLRSSLQSNYKIDIKDVHPFAEFLTVGGVPITNEMTFEQIIQNTDSCHLPLLYEGKIVTISPEVIIGDVAISSCIVEFNSQCRGWYYGWTGSRFKRSTQHSVAVSIFIRRPQLITRTENNGMVNVATFYSPSFVLVSLRRKATDLLEAAHAYSCNVPIFKNIRTFLLFIVALSASEHDKDGKFIIGCLKYR